MQDQSLSKCRACGEPTMKIVETMEKYTAPFGRPVFYPQRHTECSSCGIELDVSEPDALPNAIREAEVNSVEEILTFFKTVNVPLGRIERALELPNRIVSNWKSKESWSKSALALLRIIRAYPWIIEVADKHFRPKVVREKLLEAAHIEQICYEPAPTTGTTTASMRAPSIGAEAEMASDFWTNGISKMAAAGAIAVTTVASVQYSKQNVELYSPQPGIEVGRELGA